MALLVGTLLKLQVFLLRVFEFFVRAIGPCLVVAGFSLVGTITYYYFTVPFVPYDVHPLKRVALTGVGLWFLFNIVFNWVYCITTKPGTPSKSIEGMEKGKYGGIPTCKRCKGLKPERTHHCQVCQCCVLRMDHHCPWMNNCVGFFNYRYFVSFLIYMFLGCMFIISILVHFHHISLARLHHHPYGVTFGFLLTVSAGGGVGVLMTWHIYLTLSNQTTIEFYKNKANRFSERGTTFVNKYDIGSYQNWQAVFGKGHFSFLIPSTSPPKGDGYKWPSCKSLLLEDYDNDHTM